MNENEFLIELQAKLDEEKSKGNINSDIDKVQRQIDKLKIQAEIDPKTIQNISTNIEKLINKKIVISDIGVSQSGLSKTGQQVGNIISDSVGTAISNVASKNIGKYFRVSKSDSRQFQAEIEKLVSGWTNGKGKVTDINIQTRTSYDKDAKENIERLHQATVTYKNELDEVIKKTIAWRQIGAIINDKGEEEALRGFVEVAGQYSKSIDAMNAKTNNFVEKQKNAVASAQNTLATIESKLHDAGANKTLANTDFNANGLNGQIIAVKNAIDLLGNANLETFSQAQRDVDREINALNNLISTLKNAEYAATSLRTKNITTVKVDEGNKLEAFVQKMEQSGHYTDELKNKVSKLKSDLFNIFDVNSLTNYLNGVSNLQTEFQKVDATAKTIEKSTKLNANIDSEKKILQTYTNELKEAGILAGDVKSKVQEMFYSLSKVDTQNGLTTWRAELKGVKTEIDAALKSLSQENAEIEKLTDKVYGIQLSMEGKNVKSKNYDLQIETEIKKLKDLGFTDEEVSQKVKALTDAQAELKRVMDSGDFDSNLSKNKAIIESDNKRTEALNQVRTAYGHLKNDASQYYNLDRQNKLSTNIQNWLSKNTRASKEAKESINAYYRELNGGRVSVDRLGYIEQELKRIDASQRSLNRLGKSVKEQFAEIGRSVAQTFSIASGFMFLTSKTKDAISEMKDLDDILTEISKTSDLTSQELKELGISAYDSASKYGKTASDYLTGVKNMSQSGFYGEKGEAMAEQSLLAQAAGDMSAELADKYILASNAAYKLNGNAEKVNEILDGQNSVCNRNSVAMADMAAGMSKAGTVASSYNVAVEDLTAMLGTMEAVTKSGGEEVGNATKSILVNLQNVNSDKITGTLKKANASMTEFVNGAEKLRNPIDIIRDLAKTFNELDEDDPLRAEIITNVAGKYQADFACMYRNMHNLTHLIAGNA